MKKQILKTVDEVIAKGPFQASWDSLEGYTVPAWYEDGKFGIFIHWGVYSVPAFGNEWYPRNMYVEGSSEFNFHKDTFGPHNKFGYKDFIPMFKAEKYDPEQWAELFKQSGARFVVPVAEHHDGFQMYDSTLSKWNAAQMGPKHDVMGELADAVREHGMVFGASSHRAEHWWFMGEGRKFDSDVNDPAFEEFYGPAQKSIGIEHNWDNYQTSNPSTEFLEDWLARTCELIDKYQPQLLWFDWWIMNLSFKPYLKKLAAFYYNRSAEWNKGVAINNKYDAFPVGTSVFDVERGQLAGTRSLFWQTDTAVQKNSWGFTNNQDYKTAEDIIGDMVDIVSKNGALLLNVGPRADGTIPDKEQEILLDIGRWLKTYGEAIYSTRPWVMFGEGPTQVVEGAFTDTNRTPYTSKDFRFTKKDNILFATVLNWPDNGLLVIKSFCKGSEHLNSDVTAVELLGCDIPVKWSFDCDGLHIDASSCAKPSTVASFKVSF